MGFNAKIHKQIKTKHDICYIVLEMSSEQDTTSVPNSVRLLGQVKWFNNKAGYGFITVSDGESAGKDIFIHYSAIRVTNSQYKYLFQGEYVEFALVKSSVDTHEYQANDVSGIKGGALMCELRRPTRQFDESKPRRSTRQEDSGRPDSVDKTESDFTTVRRRPRDTKTRPPRKTAQKESS
jgi:cold shock CspA family protein